MSKKKELSPFICSSESFLGLIRNNHVIFDADAIISIVKYEALDLLDAFNEAGVVNCIVHPIRIELLCTKNEEDFVARQSVLDSYDFFELPLKKEVFQKAERLLEMIHRQGVSSGKKKKGYSPSTNDLYQGAILSSYSSRDDICLLTGDLKDFPYPIFDRKSHIVLQNNTNSRTLWFLQLSKSAYGELNENIGKSYED